MQRKATKPEIWAALQRLERAIPKPKGMTELAIPEYEDALDGVSFEALQAATLDLLRRAKFFPSTSEFFQATQRFEHDDSAVKRQLQQRLDPEANVLTPGQRLGYPLLKDDPEARARCQALWDRVRPTLGGPKSFEDAAADMAELRRQHPQPAQPSDEERMQRLKDQANEPVEVTEVLLRTLREPMKGEG